MEEHRANECSVVVYFCATAPNHDISELYHKKSPPSEGALSDNQHSPLGRVYENVGTLLDENIGGFEEVFICSKQDQCLERLETYANHAPTAVLIEFPNTHTDGEVEPSWLQDERGSLHFLRSLSSNIQGARFQKHVLAFALLDTEGSVDRESVLDGTITSTLLHAGAIDILRSPLHPDDLNRVIGHIKDLIRLPARLLASQMAQNLVDSIHNTAEPRLACHRPDLILTPERRVIVENAIARWHFPAQDFNMDELTYAAVHMVEQILKIPELEAYGLDRPQLVSFILSARRQYKHENEVHYHNWRHAVDVSQSIYCFLQGVKMCPIPEGDDRARKEPNAVELLMTPLDGLILLVSAIGHDVGHPGVNNAFLVACNHPLAQAYNDKSVLENYHCAAYSQLLRRHWPSLNRIDGFRATMISTILATDMQRHFEYMKNMSDFKAKTEASDASVDNWSEKDREQARELIMALLIKAADISNIARPFDISARWATILMNEFSRQGELESELEIPSCLFGGPPNREDVMALAQSQKGFMSLFAYPLFKGVSEIMPSFRRIVREMDRNRQTWDRKIEEEQKRRESQSAAHLSFTSLTDEERHTATSPHKSEPAVFPLQKERSPSTPTRSGPSGTSTETSPSRNATQELREQLASGMAHAEDKRSSMPFLGGLSMSPQGSSSRRSSKDVALDQYRESSAYEKHSQTLSPLPGSRRESSDAEIQVHHSYPSSRRGSKDESLTTILVTSGGTPNRRNSPASPGITSSPSKTSNARQSPQKQAQARTSIPSSKSHTTSTGTTNTAYSPSTQPSSVALDGDADPMTQPLNHAHSASVPSTEDPFKSPTNWPDDADGDHRVAGPDGIPHRLPPTPPTPTALSTTKSDSAQILTSVSSNGTDDMRSTPRKEGGLRQSRSHSRLRSLKFWKRKKDSDPTPSSGSP